MDDPLNACVTIPEQWVGLEWSWLSLLLLSTSGYYLIVAPLRWRVISCVCIIAVRECLVLHMVTTIAAHWASGSNSKTADRPMGFDVLGGYIMTFGRLLPWLDYLSFSWIFSNTGLDQILACSEFGTGYKAFSSWTCKSTYFSLLVNRKGYKHVWKNGAWT